MPEYAILQRNAAGHVAKFATFDCKDIPDSLDWFYDTLGLISLPPPPLDHAATPLRVAFVKTSIVEDRYTLVSIA